MTNADLAPTIYQSTLRLMVASRYAAHAEIDRLYAHRDRVDRPWRHSILELAPGHYMALLRTADRSLVRESPNPRAWRPMSPVLTGEQVQFIVQVAPRKTDAFNRFYESDTWAIEYVRSRVAQAVDAPRVALAAREKVWINKPRNRYSAPSGFFRVQGAVADAQAYRHLLTHPIGGSRAFGLGLPIDTQSPLYELANAITKAL